MRTRTKSVRPHQYDAIVWIARNDEPSILHPEMIAQQLTVVMAADLFDTTPEAIAQGIIALREAPGFFQ